MTRPFPFFSGSSSRKVRSQARRRTQLTFEGLEERRLMAVVAWGAQAPAAYVQNVSPAYVAPAYVAPAYTASPVTPAVPTDLPSLPAGYAAAVGGFDSSAEIIGVHNPLPENSPYRDVDDFDFELLPVEDDSAPAPAGNVIGDYYGDSPVIPAENIIIPRITGILPGLPVLDSNPNAQHTLYLNFTGSRSRGSSPSIPEDKGGDLQDHRVVFDVDGNSRSFNAEEQDAITRIWRYVADDYAPFNVNVTTFNGDLNPSRATDNVLEVAIGGMRDTGEDHDLWGKANGIPAYRDEHERAVFVFSGLHYLQSKSFLSGPDYFVRSVADTISHEAGHAYGLEHHGELVDDEWIKYREPSNEQGTSLLMGRPFIISPGSGLRSLWSWAESAPGIIQDDLSILTDRFQYFNGDGLRRDDVPDHLYKPLPEVQQGHFHAAGFIGINQADPSALDQDWFAFKNPGGPMHLRLHSPVGTFGNLQSKIELWTAHNTPNGMVEDRLVQESWSASWQNGFGFTSLPAGDYMVLVSSTGGYGNLGNYVLDITAHSSTGGLKAGGSVTGGIIGMPGISYAAGFDAADASHFEQSLAPRFLGETGGHQTQAAWTAGAWTEGYWTEGAATEGFWTDGNWTDGNWMDGHWTDGSWTDGTSTEGFWTDGNWTEGSWMDGHWTDGFWTDGASTAGYWTDGNWTDGFWTDGSWIDGHWGDGAWVDGYWNDGHWTDGSWTDGFWTNGTATEGFWTDGNWTDGFWAEGYWTDGFWTDGITTEGFWTDGNWTDGFWAEGFWTDGFWTDGTATEGFWTERLWTEGYWTDELAYGGIVNDLGRWAALNPQPLPPMETEAEFAAIDQAILWAGEELGSGLWDDALLDMIAGLA